MAETSKILHTTVKRGLLATLAAFALTAATALPASADAWERISKAGVIRISVSSAYPPFGSTGPDMRPVGLDIDLAQELAKKLGVTAELVPQAGGSVQIAAVVSGKVDLAIAPFGRTPEREKVVAFTTTYMLDFNGLYGAPDIRVTQPGELTGKKVSVPRGATEDTKLTDLAPTADISRYDDTTTALAAFASGQTDFFVTGDTSATAFAKRSPRKFDFKFKVNDEPGHMVVPKGETVLLAKLDAAITELKQNGFISSLAVKWLGKPMPGDF